MARVSRFRTRLAVEILEPRALLTVSLAGGPYVVAEGGSLSLDASQSSNVGGAPLAYTWDVNGDGVYGDAIGVQPTLDWALLNRLGINSSPAAREVRVLASDTAFEGGEVAALSSSFYQQNRVVLNGLGVVVGQGNQILFENYYGNYSSASVIPIASGSKLMSAVTLMRLVNAGLIDLDVPLSTYLPDLVWSPALKQSITLRQALSHTSGLMGNDINAVENASSLQQAAAVIASASVQLQASPGTEFDYGSNSYRLAAAAAERVTGQSWANLFQQYVAGPLEMSANYGAGNNPNPAGSGRVSARSYGNLLTMMLHEGVYKNQQFLPSSLIEEITMVQPGTTNRHPGSFYQGSALGYGFGQWIQGEDPLGRATTLSHFGANGFKGAWDRTRGLWFVTILRDPNSLTDSAGYFFNLVNQVNAQVDPKFVASPATSLTIIPRASVVPGDANGDQIVDGADYTVWADNYLQTDRLGPSQGDFDSNGVVDGSDYTEWADNFLRHLTLVNAAAISSGEEVSMAAAIADQSMVENESIVCRSSKAGGIERPVEDARAAARLPSPRLAANYFSSLAATPWQDCLATSRSEPWQEVLQRDDRLEPKLSGQLTQPTASEQQAIDEHFQALGDADERNPADRRKRGWRHRKVTR